jgi:hypothetical protein
MGLRTDGTLTASTSAQAASVEPLGTEQHAGMRALRRAGMLALKHASRRVLQSDDMIGSVSTDVRPKCAVVLTGTWASTEPGTHL